MIGLEHSQRDVVLDLGLFAGAERGELIGRDLLFEFDESGHHLLDGRRHASVADDLRVAHALESALRAVVGEAADVIHVAMCDGDVFAGERGARTGAHVETDIKLGRLDHGGFTGDRDSLDAEWRDVEESE